MKMDYYYYRVSGPKMSFHSTGQKIIKKKKKNFDICSKNNKSLEQQKSTCVVLITQHPLEKIE
jgi:hypothetical protein